MGVTTAGLVEGLTASGLVNERALVAVRKLAGQTDDPALLAKSLVKHKLVTRWQAEELLAGRTAFLLARKYRLIDKLGEGGMGTVYRAEQLPAGRVVAIKMLAAALTKNEQAQRRFMREVRAMGALRHPNIVHALDADEVDGQYFLVMEYVDARDLDHWLEQHAPLPVAWSCECIRQAACGLQRAHECGLIHRDIKPANLLVSAPDTSSEPTIKILDMGLARFTSGEKQTKLTQTDQIMGTPDYMSPEQAENTATADIRSDIFSLGVTLFEMLTGTLPWGGESAMEKLVARYRYDAPRVSSRRADIPPAVDEIVARMLSRELSERPQTPDEVAALLAPYALGQPAADGSMPTSAGGESAAATELREPAPHSGESPQRPSDFLRQLSAAQLPASSPSPQANEADPTATFVSPTAAGDASTATDAFAPLPGSTPFWKQPWVLACGGAGLLIVVLIVVATIFTADHTQVSTGTDGPHDPQSEVLIGSTTGPVRPAEQSGPRAIASTSTPGAPAPFAGSDPSAAQQQWATFLDRDARTTNGVGMQMVLIPPGSFQMGTSAEDYSRIEIAARDSAPWYQSAIVHERPMRRVTLTHPFYMAATEVTQQAFEAVGATSDQGFAVPGDDRPADQVQWLEALTFCNLLSQREGLPVYYVLDDGEPQILGGPGYRLPTEAEWEYAVRAGTRELWFFGPHPSRMLRFGWCAEDSDRDSHPVGLRNPNPWGLYDVYGNVWEWCWDRYAEYPEEAAVDPVGPDEGDRHALRGGGWMQQAFECRSATRLGYDGPSANRDTGFRPVRNLEPPPAAR